MTVLEACERDLAGLAKRDKRLAESGLAASYLQLAREMDSDSSATSKSMCAKALNETWNLLLMLAPAEKRHDKLDELAAQRERRRAGTG